MSWRTRKDGRHYQPSTKGGIDINTFSALKDKDWARLEQRTPEEMRQYFAQLPTPGELKAMEGPAQYKCPKCNKTFTSSSWLASHMYSAHRKKTSDIEREKYRISGKPVELAIVAYWPGNPHPTTWRGFESVEKAKKFASNLEQTGWHMVKVL